jgi:hypothetical protein
MRSKMVKAHRAPRRDAVSWEPSSLSPMLTDEPFAVRTGRPKAVEPRANATTLTTKQIIDFLFIIINIIY